jgi:heptosyltransferase II
MKILVRLPNWLGDMVMAVGFINQLPLVFPGVEVSVIAKKGIHELLPYFPPLQHQFIFNKADYKGAGGAWGFGRKIGASEKFDLFFCLPDSLSSAIMGMATGSKKRIGFKKEIRNLLLTHRYAKPAEKHRVEEYMALLENLSKQKLAAPQVWLQHSFPKQDYIVVNINSEASSRRLTVSKAVEVISALRQAVQEKIVLIGAPKEKPFIDEVYSKLPVTNDIESVAGKTTLPQLVQLLASAQLLLTTDSGPAHLANALKTHTVVLFGAGNEANTAPYNKEFRTIIRLGALSCEPCLKNVCVRYETPQCLERLNTQLLISQAVAHLKQTS